MSSTIDFFFPKLEKNPVLKFQYVSDVIIKMRKELDLVTGLFYAFLEKIYESEDYASMRQLKILFHFSLQIINNKVSLTRKFEKYLPDFSKKSSKLMKKLEHLFSLGSFLEESEKLAKLRYENKNVFALTPLIIIISELMKMRKKEGKMRLKDLLDEAIDIITDLIQEREMINPIPDFSEFLKMIFANIFEIKINFYKTEDFFEKKKVKNSHINSYLPMDSSDSKKKCLHILLHEKCMHSLWKNHIKFYKELDKRNKKQLFENQPMQNSFVKIKREYIKNRKENCIFRSVFDKSLFIVDQFLTDLNIVKRKDVIIAFKKIRSYRRKNPECFTNEMKAKLNSIKKKINDKFSEKYASASSIDSEEEKENETENSYFKEQDEPFDKVIIICPICENKKELSEIRTFDCDHKVCTTCAYEYLNEKYERGDWSFNITCFTSECGKLALMPPDSYYFLKDILGEEKVQKMNQKLAFDEANFKCANPRCTFSCFIDKNDSKIFFCPECNAETCIRCNELRHNGKACIMLFEKMLGELDDLDENRLRVCPFCFEPYLKNQSCEHVTCLKCKKEWCFTCSVDRYPTLAHGNHFHRIECKLFRPWEGQNEKLNEFDPLKCERCRKTNTPCQRPISMREFYAQIGLALPKI